VVVVAGIIAKYGVDGLYMCTMMAGVMLLAMGVSGLGSAVKFIPRPVVVGFTNGIAVLIASTQIRDFFGLQPGAIPNDFVGRIRILAVHFNTVSGAATLLGVATLAIVVIIPRLFERVPGTIVAMFGLTIVASLTGLPVETIGSRFGGVPSGLPHLVVPRFHVSLVLNLPFSGDDGGVAGRRRVAALGHRGRPYVLARGTIQMWN
jgi:SulP family sulfate permease